MKSRRYALLIVDSTGRPGRRIGVSRRQTLAGKIALGAVASLTLIAMLHGALRISVAHEAQQIARENNELRTLIGRLETRLPEAQSWARRAEQAYVQLRAKSGLDVDERMLGMGPLEKTEPNEIAQLGIDADGDSAVLNLEPWALPLEYDRLQQESTTVLRSVEETLEYFHDAERLLSNTPSILPVHSRWLTSSFGRRHDPMDRSRIVMHKGVDLGGFVGAEIFAPADGVVIFAGHRGGYGQAVVIDHGFGLQTHYGHLSGYRVHVGEHVHRGQVIAEMGSTGRSTGPHLHYEVRRGGEPLDPLRFILN